MTVSARPTIAPKAAPRPRFRRTPNALVIGLISLVCFFALWQLSGLWIAPVYFSTPLAIIGAAGTLIANGQLVTAVADTVITVVIALGLGAIVGISTGILMGRVRPARRVIAPMVSFANAAPTIALLPLMEIWFGIDLTARIAFAFLLCVFTILLNTLAGVESLGEERLELAHSLGLGRWLSIRRIVLPGASPHILAGLRVASAQALVGAVLAGQEVGQAGLGGLAAIFGTYFQTPQLLVSVITSTIIGSLLFLGLRIFQNTRLPWIRELGQGR